MPHWLHLFNFSPLCVFKWFLKLPAQKEAKLQWLHLFDFSPSLFVFLKGISTLTTYSLKSSSLRFLSITINWGMLPLAGASFKLRKDCSYKMIKQTKVRVNTERLQNHQPPDQTKTDNKDYDRRQR